jgi:DNA repair protein RadC
LKERIMNMNTSFENMSNHDLLVNLVGWDIAKRLAHKPLAEIFEFRRPRQMELTMGEEPAPYIAHPALAAAKELMARCMIEKMKDEDFSITSPGSIASFLCAKIGHLEHEAFWCLWVDARHHLIASQEMFRGTLTQTSVYPREVVKHALKHNASAVVLAHNHPSGKTDPSPADEKLTHQLKAALALVDVSVLDHFIVGGNQSTSFAQRGLL